MYNRYIPNGASYTRVRVEEPVGSSPGATQAKEPHQKARPGDQRFQHTGRPGPSGTTGFSLPSFLTGEGGSGGLGGLLKALKLETWTAGICCSCSSSCSCCGRGTTWSWSSPWDWCSSWAWGTRKWSRRA